MKTKYKDIVSIKKKVSKEIYIKYLEKVIKILLNNRPTFKPIKLKKDEVANVNWSFDKKGFTRKIKIEKVGK